MKKLSLFLAAAMLLPTVVTFAQPPEPSGLHHGKLLEELKLTDSQKEQFDKTRYETQKRQIDLRAKIATARLDLQKLMAADSPDKSSIEKKFTEIASLQTSLRMNHLNAWFENNKVLTPEQQKIWKKVLVTAPQEMRKKMRGMHRNNDTQNEMPMRRQW